MKVMGNDKLLAVVSSGNEILLTEGETLGQWNSAELGHNKYRPEFYTKDNISIVCEGNNWYGMNVYMSDDYGETWENISEDLFDEQVTRVLGIDNNYGIYCQTRYGGVYRYQVKTSSISTEYVNKKNLMIYPNPAREYIKLNCGGFPKVSIFDEAGEMVLQTKGSHINISTLHIGAYIAVIQNGDNISREIFIKR
jgi:hypothetical protein